MNLDQRTAFTRATPTAWPLMSMIQAPLKFRVKGQERPGAYSTRSSIAASERGETFE